MIQTSKILLREQIRSKRHDLLEDDIALLSALINKRLRQEELFNNCNYLATYMAFDNEPNLSIPKNKKIFLPKVKDEKLTFHLKTNNFIKNRFGIEEPVNNNEFPINKIQLILIPLVVFNSDLYRIGYGGGYYDKTLNEFSRNNIGPELWGVGYDFQMVNTNFQKVFDIRLNKVITDKRVYV